MFRPPLPAFFQRLELLRSRLSERAGECGGGFAGFVFYKPPKVRRADAGMASDGAAKGKIERFFRTVRDQFLNQTLDLSTLEKLNGAFYPSVENDYNAREHSTLKMKPLDRFALDLKRIRFLDPMEANEELFFFEKDRFVRKDNTLQIKNLRYEAPRDLSNRKVQVRYDRTKLKRIIVYSQGERMGEATPLDFLSNDRAPAR